VICEEKKSLVQNTQKKDGCSWRTWLDGDMGVMQTRAIRHGVKAKAGNKAWQTRTSRCSTTGRQMKLAGLLSGP